jgi:hypothetical protein
VKIKIVKFLNLEVSGERLILPPVMSSGNVGQSRRVKRERSQ